MSTTISSAPLLADAAAIMDRAAAENFTVASRLLPATQRARLRALYGFARLVDYAGDEAQGDRDALLDTIDAQLDLLYRGGEVAHPLMHSLASTVSACRIPREPLDALIAANRQDQRVNSYRSFEELLAYCQLSANPIGRVVLHIFDAATPERLERSDRICTALQLAEHWQDVVEDHARGRVYVPAEDLERFACQPADLAVQPAPERVRALIRFEVDRAAALLDAGAPLVATLRGRARFAVAGFVAGGRAALGAIKRASYDVSAGPPRATRTARARALTSVLLRGGR